MTNLLINEPPLQVLPSLAAKIGLNEAIILQQIHYWLRISKNIRDGFTWVYKSYPEWKDEFPFWSESTIKRTITSLEKQEVIISTSKYNKMKIDRTKWYRINYEKLMNRPSGQNDPTMISNCPDSEVNMTRPIGQNDTTNNQRLLQENTTENTTRDYNHQPDMEFVKVKDFYESNFSRISPMVGEMLGGLVDDFDTDLVLYAFEITALNPKVSNPMRYATSILNGWQKNLVTTRQQAEIYESKKRGERNGQNNPGSHASTPSKDNRPRIFGDYCSD